MRPAVEWVAVAAPVHDAGRGSAAGNPPLPPAWWALCPRPRARSGSAKGSDARLHLPARSFAIGGVFLAFSKNAFLENFANFWRARSRLYQNEILQENMRLTAFFKLYKICILLHRCNLKIFAKNRFEKTAIFVKFQQKNCKCRKFCKFLPNFKNFS